MERFTQYPVQGSLVAGTLHLPDLSGPEQGFPSVVMLHRWQSNRIEASRHFVLLSRLLAARGVASFRPDFRGCGESEGDATELSVARQLEDVETAFRYVRQQEQLDPERVMLLGYGLGGLIATLSVAKVQAHRLALWSPALPEFWLKYMGTNHLFGTAHSFGPFVKEVIRTKPLDAAREWVGVAQVFHGDQDTICPVAWGVEYAKALDSDAVGIPNADHLFEQTEQAQMLYNSTLHFLLGQS